MTSLSDLLEYLMMCRNSNTSSLNFKKVNCTQRRKKWNKSLLFHIFSFSVPRHFPVLKWHCCLWALCTNMPNSANAGLLSGPLMLRTFPISAAANRWTVRQQGMDRVGLTDLKSVERQFLLIWLNQWRQMQLIHNSGNSQILRWALTYITMTSKQNFRGHVFYLFILPALIPSLSQSHHSCCIYSPPSPAVWKRHVYTNKINWKVTLSESLISVFWSCVTAPWLKVFSMSTNMYTNIYKYVSVFFCVFFWNLSKKKGYYVSAHLQVQNQSRDLFHNTTKYRH